MGLVAGTPAPVFRAASPVNPRFAFSSLGGRYVLMAFLPPPGPEREAALQLIRGNPAIFQTDRALFFGVLPDAESFASARNILPFHWFFDPDGEIRRLYEAVDESGRLQPRWVLIDPSQRIMAAVPLEQGQALISHLVRAGDPDDHAGVAMHAPVLIVPRVFEPKLCQRLMAYYAAQGGQPSGTMQERDGRTIAVQSDFKKRSDATLTDPALINETRGLLQLRLLPEIAKAFQFRATRIERYIVACYDALDGGYFQAHRDNTTPGTAHRKFAVSINLNAEQFEGGDLRFPEFGRKTYRPPSGGAVVFSCSLLHEATPVTRGTRYAFLPFLYDEEGARVREQNLHSLKPAPEPAEAD